MDPLVGRTLDNKYLMEKLLGKGGMGSVYMAVHTGTKRTVAVKVIAPQYMRNRELLIRFQREGEATGRLRHPNVVNVTDFGVTVIDTTPVAYLVMEYLDGETLFERLTAQPLLPPTLAVEILEQISLGVSEAHGHGILHRDLKPQNIWLQPDGRGGYIVKVLDFGIAKLADPSALTMELPELEAAPNDEEAPSADENATQVIAVTEMGFTSAFAEASGFTTTVGATLGTPAFMSPEQCSGKAVNEKSDLYSLAMMAYMMFAGELPFKGNARDLIEKQILHIPDAPHTRNPKLSETVSRVILESLAKDPDLRAPNCASFVARVRASVEGEVSLLKESRTIGSGNSGVWLAILVMAMLPSNLFLYGVRSIANLVLEAHIVSEWVLVAFVLLVHSLSAYCSMVWADMAMTSWVNHTRDHEPSIRAWFSQMLLAWARLPRALAAAVFTLSPVQNALAHIVILNENLSVRESEKRSAQLLAGSEHIALALLIRRFAVAWMVAFYLPVVFILTQIPVQVMFHEYLGRGAINALSVASFSFMPIYGSFLLAWNLLYQRTLRGLGESTTAISRRYVMSRARVGERFRLGTKVWAVLPLLLLGIVVILPLSGWNEKFGGTLSSAVLEGRRKDVEAALAKGVNINDGKGPNRNALTIAVQNGDAAMVEFLLSKGAKIETPNENAGTLHYAVIRHRPAMVKLLLDHGAATEIFDNTNDTPLALAAKSGQLDIVKMLLASGAKRDTKDADGKTPADSARAQGHLDIANLLEAK